MTATLGILQHTDQIPVHRSSTITSLGKTGVGHVYPENKAVLFDEQCRIENWIYMVRHIGDSRAAIHAHHGSLPGGVLA